MSQGDRHGCLMAKSKIFTSNRSQAVRLPKALAFPDDVQDVEILKIGHSRLVAPLGRRWDDFFDAPPTSEDFLSERHQPDAETREPL